MFHPADIGPALFAVIGTFRIRRRSSRSHGGFCGQSSLSVGLMPAPGDCGVQLRLLCLQLHLSMSFTAAHISLCQNPKHAGYVFLEAFMPAIHLSCALRKLTYAWISFLSMRSLRFIMSMHERLSVLMFLMAARFLQKLFTEINARHKPCVYSAVSYSSFKWHIHHI